MFDNVNLSDSNRYLGLLAVVMVVYATILVYCQSIRGISYWDIFVYLQNAMLFSNINIGSQLGVAPVLSLITAIPFRMGFIGETSLFVVSGILFIFLVIGIYLLFNERFDAEISFVASLIFSMLSLIVTWAVTGATDVPALCFAVWALYFTIRGLKSNFNYYYPAIICFVLAFFTRFTEGFILIVMGYYVLINFNEFKRQLTLRRILCLLLFVLVIGLVICGVYISYQGTIPFISQFLEVSSSSQVSSVNVGYDLNPFYYLENLPQYLTSFGVSDSYFTYLSTSNNAPTIVSYLLLALVFVYLLIFVGNIRGYDDSIYNRNLKVGTLAVLSLLSIITYTHVSYMITEILFTLILLLYYMWLQDNDNQMDYMMVLWMGIFIILHSYHPVKVDRYIIPIMIPLTYMMTRAVTILLKDKKRILAALTIILILMLPINAGYMMSITQENPHTHEEITAAEWLEQYDPNYSNRNISSDRGVVFSWYLKKYVYTTIPRVLEANNESLIDKLDSVNAKYYIDSTSNTTNITGYTCIYDNNRDIHVKIYERM
ncbi:MAG: hypothetical protein BZ135_07560 [Methanosphaera sp. rholeuAM6]|nr:MAG: hypothetical protein BZ135_07560 [Methanosphaera sp. rholeuAM6]